MPQLDPIEVLRAVAFGMGDDVPLNPEVAMSAARQVLTELGHDWKPDQKLCVTLTELLFRRGVAG